MWRIYKRIPFANFAVSLFWKPECYITLPIFGPSNERDTVGLAADTAANPLTHIAPYPAKTPEFLTYVSPYTYISYGILYNNLSDRHAGSAGERQ